MSEWKKVKFGELYAIESRNGLSKPSRIRGTGYKMINMGELFSNDRIYDIPMELVPLNEKEKETAKIEKNDLLFARQSLVLEGAGKCSIVLEVSDLTVFESHLIRVRLNLQKANPLFYYYFFRSYSSPMKTIVSQCAQAGIKGSDLQRIEVDYPPLLVQHRIATILSRYDSLIENYQKQIKLLEEAAQRLYKEWFVDLRFPGHENTKIVDGVPEGWTKSSLEEICSVSKKVISPSNMEKGRPYIGLEHMPRKDFCLSVWGKSEDISSSKYEYKENDILFGKIRPYFHKVGFAINNGYASTDSIIMQPKLGLWGLLLMTVYSDRFVKNTSQACKEGAKMPRADWNQMKKYPILIASDNVQYTFERSIKITANRIKEVATQIRLLTEARDRLLPKLMSGEIQCN